MDNDQDNADDLQFMMMFLIMADDIVDTIDEEESSTLQDHINEQQRLCRSLPLEKTRPTWIGYCNRVSDSHFHRQFRLSRNAFSRLCSILSTVVGEGTFRRENSLQMTCNAASLQSRGGLIPGEIKVAIALRVLSGGSYLDLMPLFDVSVPYIYVILDQFLEWMTAAFHFPLWGFLLHDNWDALGAIAEPFSYGSNGAFSGIIGALDGLAIRIRSPSLQKVSDPGNYYCRKGFFALNVSASNLR